MANNNGEERLTLRINEDEKEKIKKIAKENARSMNGEIEYAIKKHIKMFEEATGKKL